MFVLTDVAYHQIFLTDVAHHLRPKQIVVSSMHLPGLVVVATEAWYLGFRRGFPSKTQQLDTMLGVDGFFMFSFSNVLGWKNQSSCISALIQIKQIGEVSLSAGF